MLLVMLDVAVLAALTGVGYSLYKLKQRLTALQSNQSEFRETVMSLSAAVDEVRGSLDRVLNEAVEAARDLAERQKEADEAILRAARLVTALDEKTTAARALKDDLELMMPAVERIADRLSGLASEARQSVPFFPENAADVEDAGSPEEPTEKDAGDKEADLIVLEGISEARRAAATASEPVPEGASSSARASATPKASLSVRQTMAPGGAYLSLARRH